MNPPIIVCNLSYFVGKPSAYCTFERTLKVEASFFEMSRISAKTFGILTRVLLSGFFIGLTAFKGSELFKEETGISLKREYRDVNLPTINICFGTEKSIMEYMDVVSVSQFIDSTEVLIYQSKRSFMDHTIENGQWKQSFYFTFKDAQMMPCFYLDPPIEAISYPDFAYVDIIIHGSLINLNTHVCIVGFLQITINLKKKIPWLVLEFAEKNDIQFDYIWNPINHIDLRNVKGQYFFELTMEIHEYENTRQRKCYEMKESTHYQCRTELYMKKLNCSFPWQSSSGLEPCNTRQDVAKLVDLVAQMAHRTSDLKRELKSLDCWFQKCNQTSWTRQGLTIYKKAQTNAIKIGVYSSPGVSNKFTDDSSKTLLKMVLLKQYILLALGTHHSRKAHIQHY